jgi:hypothetical protein
LTKPGVLTSLRRLFARQAKGKRKLVLSFRFNNRKAADLFGMTVRRMALAGNLPYAKLVEENAFTPFVRP